MSSPENKELFKALEEGLLSIGKAAGVDIKAELAQRQIYEFSHFLEYEQLEEFAKKAGLDDSSPTTVIYAFKDSIDGYRHWQLEEPIDLKEPRTLQSLLDTTADFGAFMDDTPNDFTIGLVLALPENRQLAIRYKLEEYEVEDDSSIDSERSFGYIQQYDAVVCGDYEQLSWHSAELVE